MPTGTHAHAHVHTHTHTHTHILCFFFLRFFFKCEPFLKVFIESVTTLLLFYVLDFWPQGMWALSSPIRGWLTHCAMWWWMTLGKVSDATGTAVQGRAGGMCVPASWSAWLQVSHFLHKELFFILPLQCRADPTELEFCFWLKITCFMEQLRSRDVGPDFRMEVGLVRQGKETPLSLIGALDRTISTNSRSLRGNC